MNVVRRGRTALGILCFVAATGCGESGSALPDWTVADSSGIPLLSGPFPQDERAVVADAPGFVVLEAEGTPLFRVASVVPRDDGSFLVLDAGNQRVLSFDETGSLQANTGHRGDGPGEFQAPSILAVTGDSVLVYDSRHRRVTVLGPQLQLIRDQLLEGRDGFSPPRFVGATDPRTWIGLETVRTGGIPSAGLLRTPVRHVVLDPDGPRLIAEGRGNEAWVSVQTEGGQITSVNVIGHPFYRRTIAATGAGHLVVADTDEWMLSDFTTDGTLLRRFRVDRAPEAFESTTIDEYLNTLVDLTAEERRSREENLENIALPPTLPAFSAIIVDDQDQLWARVFDLDAAAEQVWVVFDEMGATGLVRTPAHFTISTVRDGTLWGVFRDEFDVESVRAYALERTS